MHKLIQKTDSAHGLTKELRMSRPIKTQILHMVYLTH